MTHSTTLAAVKCPLCGQNSARQQTTLSAILSLPQDMPNQVCECANCGFRFLFPYFSEVELDELYSGSYFEGTDNVHAEGSALNYEEDCAAVRVDKFAATLDKLRQIHPQAKRILDVGAATGEFLAIAKERGLEPYGIELSEWACQRAKDKFGLDLHNGPFEKYSPDVKFDLIHLNHVLEHFPDPKTAVAKMREVLTPGGLVYIEVPYQFNQAELMANKLGLWKRSFSIFSLHHPVFFTPATLRKLFTDFGFTVVSLQCLCWDRYGGKPKSMSVRLARLWLKAIRQGQLIEGVFQLD